MRYTTTIILFLLAIATHNSIAQAMLKGNIANAKGIEITYIPTLHGNFFLSGYVASKPDAMGNFTINLDTDTTSLLSFYANDAFWRIIIAPKDQDSLFIDLKNPKNIQFFGKNARINQFLNNNIKREKYFSGFLDTPSERQLMSEFTGAIVHYKTNNMRDSELVDLGRFAKTNNLDSVAYRILENDIRYYHASLFNSMTLSAYKQSLKAKESPFDSTWAKTWDIVMQTETISNDAALGSYWYHDFTDKFVDWYRGAFKKDIDVTKLDLAKGENIFELEQIIRRFFQGKALEATLANMIHEEALQEQMQPTLISIYNRFTADFPKSRYHPYLAQVIRPIADKWMGKSDTTAISQGEDIFLIDNQDKITTVEHLLTLFKGKVLYIDLWATWCQPCKQEFKYKNDLESFTKGKNIEKLYISIDKADKEKIWEDAIGFYELGGHHIRANPSLIADIRTRFGGEKGELFIPRYLIVNANGEVVVQNAKRPSEKELLYRELSEVLK